MHNAKIQTRELIDPNEVDELKNIEITFFKETKIEI